MEEKACKEIAQRAVGQKYKYDHGACTVTYMGLRDIEEALHDYVRAEAETIREKIKGMDPDDAVDLINDSFDGLTSDQIAVSLGLGDYDDIYSEFGLE